MGGTLMGRMRAWWRGLPLMRAFLCYTVLWACAVLGVSVLVLIPLTAVYKDVRYGALADAVEINPGPYLYDAARAELVPAVTIDLGGDTSRLAFLSAAGLVEQTPEPSAGTEGQQSHRSVYATLDMLADDPELELFDWGGNYIEADYRAAGGNPYNPEPIAVSELAAYDEQARASRAPADEGVADVLGTGGRLLVSNIGYYVSQPASQLEGAAMAVRLAMVLTPFVVGALLAILLFRRFYVRRMRAPLGTLRDAADHIARQDLDFVTGDVAGREFGALAQAFESMRISLHAAQRALWETAEERRRLNAAFAHDLRTPLTVLKGTVEMMRLRAERAALPAAGQRDAASPAASGDAEDDLHEKMLASIDVLAGQVTRLEDYCRAITSVTKLEDRTVDRRETGYVQLAENLARFARALVEASGLACSFAASSEHPLPIDDPGRVRVFVDEALVEEALGNLIANACRFAVQTVGIEVTLIHLAERGQQRMCLQVKVADDGPGFSADALRHGCEAFFSEQKSAEHFGLGLSIASMLARLHGGGITLVNADGGAVATVLIDVSRQP